MARQKKQKKFHFLSWQGLVLLLVFVVLASGVSYAWLRSQRRVAAGALIDSPMSIYINAGHLEDVLYLDLSGIDMERTDPLSGDRYNYQDFVFAVRGEDLQYFRLQLAYTTNNQFQFELYRALEYASPAAGRVEYHAANGTSYYYERNGAKLTLNYLNTLSGDMLGDPADELNVETYKAGGGKYGNVDQYAEPVYCKVANAIAVENLDGLNFYNYFILRVKWDPSRQNDRETDILYIAAKAGAV